MSESFNDVLAVCSDAVKEAHEREFGERFDRRFEQIRRDYQSDHDARHERELEKTRHEWFHKGYEAGIRKRDTDTWQRDQERAKVVGRLRSLTFVGDSHENLSKVSYAVYPCATGWTCESTAGLRDRLVQLLGGDMGSESDSGRGCACGNRDSGDSGEPAKAMTYDVLGNERHRAVCELRKLRERDVKIWNIEISIALGLDLDVSNDNVCDRLIYLLGGDQPDLQKSPIFEDSGTDDAGEITITDELRKFATDPLLGYASQELHVERITAIADRIDEQFGHIYHQQGAILQSAISYLTEECNKLHAARDELRAKLDEADAAIANWPETDEEVTRDGE